MRVVPPARSPRGSKDVVLGGIAEDDSPKRYYNLFFFLVDRDEENISMHPSKARMAPRPTPGIFRRGMEYMTLADRHGYRRLVDYGLFKSDASLARRGD
jgi:hypothetical protein